MSRDKCTKCIKSVKDGIQCFQCENTYHMKCVNVSDELYESMRSNTNIKWFCDGCMKLCLNIKSMAKAISEAALTNNELNKFKDSIMSEISAVKSLISLNNDNLNKLNSSEMNFDEKLSNLKKDMSNCWADVVKKNIDKVGEQVKIVQKSIDEAQDMNEREKNLMMFRLDECESDYENVFKIITSLSDGSVKRSDIIKITRLGMKKDGSIRPVSVRFLNSDIRDMILKNAFKIKKLNNDFPNVSINEDLTQGQRAEVKKLIEQAKASEASSDGNFLYRVRGKAGKWKIVKIPKKSTT